jgi:hypothetical protein
MDGGIEEFPLLRETSRSSRSTMNGGHSDFVDPPTVKTPPRIWMDLQ